MKKRLIAQGKPFAFSAENLKNAQILILRYPPGRQASAIVPLLDLAQRQCQGWLPKEAVEYVASYIGVSLMQGYEVATFYSMFNLSPVGKYFIQVCTTTPCGLRGAEDVLKVCREAAGVSTDISRDISSNHISPDGLFSVTEVECLGACINAPVVQINDDYHEDMTALKTFDLIQALKLGQEPTQGAPHPNVYISEAGTKKLERVSEHVNSSTTLPEGSNT